MCEQSENINELVTALAAFQAEVKNPPKTKKVDMGTYDYYYAPLDEILDYVRPLLSKHGLVITQFTGDAEGGVSITTQLSHKSGQWMRTQFTMTQTDRGAKGKGSAITYGSRYSLCPILVIAGETDDDGTAATGDEGVVDTKQEEDRHTTATEAVSQSSATTKVDYTKRQAPRFVIPAEIKAFRQEWIPKHFKTTEHLKAAGEVMRGLRVNLVTAPSISHEKFAEIQSALTKLHTELNKEPTNG